MQIIEVNTEETRRKFIDLPIRLYKDDLYWIRPLNKDIEDGVFNPSVNKFFKHGKIIRWIIKEENGEIIGRIAAFINKKTENKTDVKTGGVGFFECINNKEAAFLLFDTAKFWLQKEGVEAMDGPINFGERDKWWGLLVNGFVEPNYCMPYNFPYYQNLFEKYGFQLYFKQFTFQRAISDPLQDSWIVKAKRIAEDNNYTFRHLEKSKLYQYGEYFRIIYNKAWAAHSGVSEMAKEQARSIMKQIKPILDPELIWFSFYKDEPVGFFIMLPELNQIFKYLNGNLNWWGKLKFLWFRMIKPTRKVFGVAFGIIPEHQGKGVEGAMVNATAKLIQPKNKYDTLEMNWIGDFNPKMIHLCESLGAKVVKTHHTYRYLFDRKREFNRAPIMD